MFDVLKYYRGYGINADYIPVTQAIVRSSMTKKAVVGMFGYAGGHYKMKYAKFGSKGR